MDVTNIVTILTGLSSNGQEKVWGTVFVLLFVWLLKRASLSILGKRITDATVLYQWRKVVGYTFSGIAIILIARIWFAGIGSIATFLGLLSAGVAFALKDPIVNFAGWGFILLRKPYDVGDRIELGAHRGDVIDINLFYTAMMELGNWVNADQSTGRVIYVPNGKVFTEIIVNYNKGFHFIWNELPVMVTFESDWQKALKILEGIANERTLHLSEQAEKNLKIAAQKMMIFYNTLSPTVYVSIADSGVTLTVRYLCAPKQRRGSAQAIAKDILEAFAKEDDIDFAYPTQRLYFNPVEGKPDAKASLSVLKDTGLSPIP